MHSFLESRITGVCITLILTAIAYSGRVNVTISVILLFLAFLNGSFGIFRSSLRGYHRFIGCLILGIGLAVVLWWIQPNPLQPKRPSTTENPLQQPKQSANGKPRLPITTAELEQNLRRQIQFLQRSSAYFDQGEENEAIRISTNLHIMFIGMKDGPSLLEQLRIRDELLLPNTADEDVPGNLVPYLGLVGFGIKTPGGPWVWTPHCQYPFSIPPKFVPFEKWWRQIISDNRKGVAFTREGLISAVSEQDGGINVPNNLDPVYVELARKNAMGWQSGGKPLVGFELASIREIGWEALEALRQHCPQYFSE